MRRVVGWSIFASAAILFASWLIVRGTSAGAIEVFGSSLGVNVAAGFLGGAVSFLIAATLARQAALSRLKSTGTPIARFVRQMRVDQKVSQQAARAAIVVAAKLLTDIGLSDERKHDTTKAADDCQVCGLDYEIKTLPSGDVACAHCELQGAVWCLADDSES